jgi:L-asparaginase
MTPLVFLSCGGTIEKIYFPDSGELGFDRSRISDWAKTCRIAQPYRTETLMLIDSLDMTQEHRENLANRIASLPESQIVVLHGTDTMVDSAKEVMLRRKEHHVVVFTGAMVPASQEHSDALFNLGLATAAVQTLDPGVYIAMSGKIFPADQATKNTSLGLFQSTSAATPNKTKNNTL